MLKLQLKAVRPVSRAGRAGRTLDRADSRSRTVRPPVPRRRCHRAGPCLVAQESAM